MEKNDFNKIACLPSHLLSIELQQSADEGKESSSFAAQAADVAALSDAMHIEREQRATELFFKLRQAPVIHYHPYSEPSGWGEMKAECEVSPLRITRQEREVSFEKIWGGVLGKCIGCLLGKPIEGWKKIKISDFLNETDNFPLRRYLFENISEDVVKKYSLSPDWDFPVAGMPEDDDVNYLLLAFQTIKRFGLDFNPDQVAQTWTDTIPLNHLYTAERIAYRNFTNGIYPPESAWFCNPYREWIGAQIRADVYGYLCPGNPLLARELAWKDASISHVKNGIYGSVWVAVMLALIPNCRSWAEVVAQSLTFIPTRSRFHESIAYILQAFKGNCPLETVLLYIHNKYSENNIHHWCHVLPNAMIVAMALLWGKHDFLTSLQITITAGFDTDSNGATVGSLMGYLIGAGEIPGYWKNALKNKIFSSVAGMGETNIKEFAIALFNLSGHLAVVQET